MRFGQSEVVLHSNASKYKKIWRTRPRTFLRMVGEYRPWSFFHTEGYLNKTSLAKYESTNTFWIHHKFIGYNAISFVWLLSIELFDSWHFDNVIVLTVSQASPGFYVSAVQVF